MNSYIAGYHGCATTSSKNLDFKVPQNVTIILFNSLGVLSHGDINIPFIVNLYNTNRNLFDYIFNKYNYSKNLDKTDVRSYRHPDFFKFFPFYSSLNYLCNFEMYPAKSQCPQMYLFPSEDPNSSNLFFEGITHIENIITADGYGARPKFNDNDSVILNPTENGVTSMKLSALIERCGQLGLHETNGTNETLYFISACRAEYYKNAEGHDTILRIDSIEKNCKSFDEYDVHVFNKELEETFDETTKNNIIKTQNRMLERRRYQTIEAYRIGDAYSSDDDQYYPDIYNTDPKISLYNILHENIYDTTLVVNFVKILVGAQLNIFDKIYIIRKQLMSMVNYGYNDIKHLDCLLKYINVAYNHIKQLRKNDHLRQHRDFFESDSYVMFSYIYEMVNDVLNHAYQYDIDPHDKTHKKTLTDMIIHTINAHINSHGLQIGGKFLKYANKTSRLLKKIKLKNK